MNPTKELKKLIPVKIEITEKLTDKEQALVDKLIQVLKKMGHIYYQQVYSKNLELLDKFKDGNDDTSKLFRLNYGPFNRLSHNESFVEGHIKPHGANFYPADMTKEEFLEHIKEYPQDKESFESNYTVIRRRAGKLIAVPYSVEFKGDLEEAADLVKEAAKLTDNESLKKYLSLLSESFLKDDYFDSDIAWMDLKDNKIEALIGPYEVYEDELFGYKTAFEGVLGVVDEKASKELQMLSNHLEELENNLPIPDENKNSTRGSASPIIVMDQIYSQGDCRAGIHFTAFNLPNDERVREAKGSKKVMMNNIGKAKYENCTTKILKRVLTEQDYKDTNYYAYFTHVLLHEMAHGLGPGTITVNGEPRTVNAALKELYSTIEECKADILGVWNAFYLIDKGFYEKELEKQIVTSFVGSTFRSMRFGINEAHAGGNLVAYNFLKERKLIENKNEKLHINHDVARSAFKELAEQLLIIEAEGNYEKAKEFIQKYRVVTPEVESLLKSMEDIPIDILPTFDIEN